MSQTPVPKKTETTNKLLCANQCQQEEETFTDVLEKLRMEVNSYINGATMVSARATEKDDDLILLDNKSNKEAFTTKFKRVVESHSRDSDPLATKDENDRDKESPNERTDESEVEDLEAQRSDPSRRGNYQTRSAVLRKTFDNEQQAATMSDLTR